MGMERRGEEKGGEGERGWESEGNFTQNNPALQSRDWRSIEELAA
jgi:hypothetical protein